MENEWVGSKVGEMAARWDLMMVDLKAGELADNSAALLAVSKVVWWAGWWVAD